MKRRQLVLISLGVLVIVSVGGGVYRLWNDRFWPFATGTEESAFLRTTFGMSPPEVRRSLAKSKATLLSYEEYRRADPSPSIEIF